MLKLVHQKKPQLLSQSKLTTPWTSIKPRQLDLFPRVIHVAKLDTLQEIAKGKKKSDQS